jgi:PAS domain S-box-containing protein
MPQYCNLHHTCYDSLIDGVIITDSVGSILYNNRAINVILNFVDRDTNYNLEMLVKSLSDRGNDIRSLQQLMILVKSDPCQTGSVDISLDQGIEINIQSIPYPVGENDLPGRIWVFKKISRNQYLSEQLEKTDNLFRMIFDLIPEGIAISDLNTGKFIEVNEHFTRWWGYTREEVIGKSAIDLNFWVDVTQRRDIINQLKLKGSCELVPVKMRAKNGDIMHILFSAREIILNNSHYMLSIPLDITNVIKFEEKIWCLASFIELNPNPIFELDEYGRIVMQNAATSNVIKELTKSDDITRFIPEDLDEILNAIRNGTETTFNREVKIKDQVFFEYIYVTKQYRTARIYLINITDKKKAEIELLKKNEDLGTAYEEIISAEEELRQNYDKLYQQEQILDESEKKLRIILDHIPGVVLTTDTNMNVKSIFGVALEKMSISQEKMVGVKIEEIFGPIDKNLLNAHILALKGKISTTEGYYRNRYVMLYVSPLLDKTEKITGTIGIAIDVTEQKNLEKEQKRLLLQLEQNLVQLAVLNDKIRNPLTVISTLVEMNAPEIEGPINRCILDIDDIITNLDQRWNESEKAINFLQKHYGIGLE